MSSKPSSAGTSNPPSSAASHAPSAGPSAAASNPASAAAQADRPGGEPGYSCAICGTKVPAPGGAVAEAGAAKAAVSSRYRPFCSARCQRIDLGNWLDERYVVPGPPAAAGDKDDPDGEPA